MKSSLYAQYILEKEGTQCLEAEDSYITYKIAGPEIHIFDLFVIKEKRSEGVGFGMCKKLEKIAKDKGCNYAKATVAVGTTGDTEALKFHLRYGMRVLSSNSDYIVLGKEI